MLLAHLSRPTRAAGAIAAVALTVIGAHARAASPDTVRVPGGIAAVSRYLGHVDPEPARFIDSTNRVLLRQIRRDLDPTRIDDRVRLSAYLREIGTLRERFGEIAAFDPADPAAGARFAEFLLHFGYEADRAGLPAIREIDATPEFETRRRVAEALGWNLRAAAHALAGGHPVSMRIATDAVPSPVPFARWSAVTGTPPTPETALSVLVDDVAWSLVAEGLRRAPPGTRQRLDDATLAAIYREAPVEFARYADALEFDGRGLVPPGGRAAIPAWRQLLAAGGGGPRRGGPGREAPLDGEGAEDAGRLVRTLLVEDDAIGAHLWHALTFAPPADRAFFLAPSPEGDPRRVRLRRFAEHLLALGGPGAFRAGLGATVSIGEALRHLDVRPTAVRADPALARALTSPRIGPDCSAPSGPVEGPAERGGAADGGTLPLLMLDEGRRVERRHELPFRASARVREVLERVPALATPSTVLLLRRAERDHPDALDVVRRLAPGERAARTYLQAVEALDCESPSADRTRNVKTFQGGVELLVGARRNGAIDDDAASDWLDRWSASWRSAGNAGVPAADAAAALRALVEALAEAAPEAGGRGPLERRALSAIAGPRPTVATFDWDGVAYDADRAADLSRRMAEEFVAFDVPSLDDALSDRRAASGALTTWLVAAAYARGLAVLDDPDFRQRGLFDRHRLEEPAYGGPESVPLMSGWKGCRLVAAAHDGTGAHVVGSLHAVDSALVRHYALAYDPWRPPHTWIDVRPWMTAALRSDWMAMRPETARLVDALTRLGRAVESRAGADLAGAAAIADGIVPAGRWPSAPGVESRVSPSERFALGLRVLERRESGGPLPDWISGEPVREAEAARAAAGPRWRRDLDAVGIPTPETDGRAGASVGGWSPYETFQDDLVPRELRERLAQDVAVTVAGFAGRRGLPGPVALDTLLRVLERVPEEAAVASERDWESFVRWISRLDDDALETSVRECLERGLYRARWDRMPAVADGAIRFVEPAPGAPLIGEVRFRFEVLDPDVRRIDLFVGDRPIGSATGPDWSRAWTADRTSDGAEVIALARTADRTVGRARLRTARLGDFDRVRVDLVQVYPVVRSITGEYVRDLERDDFEVLEDGRPVEIRHFDASATRLSMALVLDVSRSMADKLGRVTDASIGFAESLGEDDAVALYAFNHRLERIVPLTRDRERIRTGIWNLPCAGGTALYDALVRVVDDLRDVPGRKAIFVFSDGLDELSLTPLADAVRAATRGEVLVYAAGIVDAFPTGKPGREDLEVLARSTGGESHFILFAHELPKIYRRVREHLLAQYALAYVPLPGPSGLRTIDVRVRFPSLHVQARRSYDYVRDEKKESSP